MVLRDLLPSRFGQMAKLLAEIRDPSKTVCIRVLACLKHEVDGNHAVTTVTTAHHHRYSVLTHQQSQLEFLEL